MKRNNMYEKKKNAILNRFMQRKMYAPGKHVPIKT